MQNSNSEPAEGPELDAAVARALGCKMVKVTLALGNVLDECSCDGGLHRVPGSRRFLEYSTDTDYAIGAANSLLSASPSALTADRPMFQWDANCNLNGVYRVTLDFMWTEHMGEGDTLALAICRAIVAWAEEQQKEKEVRP